MPIRHNNQQRFYRYLYAGELYTITLLKRGDDQKEGTQTALTIFNCRRGNFSKTGEPLQGITQVYTRTRWMLPMAELKRVGVSYINPGDRIVNAEGTWLVESHDTIEFHLFSNYLTVTTVKV